jgi:hypothetical protein
MQTTTRNINQQRDAHHLTIDRIASARRPTASHSPVRRSVAEHRYTTAIVCERPRLLPDLSREAVVW